MVGRMVESVSTATTALISLVQLLDKVKNMVISDVIQREVEGALRQLQEVRALAQSVTCIALLCSPHSCLRVDSTAHSSTFMPEGG